MTDFVDFVILSGTPRLTKVRQLVGRGAYDPKHDYWRQLREGLKEFHENRPGDKSYLLTLAETAHKSKRDRYRAAVAGYKKFLGRQTPEFSQPPTKRLVLGDLIVRVNPELGLTIRGENHVIKLYFKDEKPRKNRIEVVLQIMEDSLRQKTSNATMSVLDVSAGRLHSGTGDRGNIKLLADAEAQAFVTIWKGLSASD